MRLFDTFEPARQDELIRRPALEARDITADVRQILETVRRRGDAALLEFTERFDGVRLPSLAIPTTDARVEDVLWEAMLLAARNIRSFHEGQREPIQHQVTSPGIRCWRKSVPIESVGLYIPGGTAPLFSTVLMLALPAAVAGCSNVVLCTPPDSTGSVPAAILVAARLAGIDAVYAVGGAQAIAAMAYGMLPYRAWTRSSAPATSGWIPPNGWLRRMALPSTCQPDPRRLAS